jgi:putative SOS response-associated peptidase YedK
VPAGLFYEWRRRRRAAIRHRRRDQAPLPIGGLWEGWRSQEGEVLRTFTIIATAANREVSELHDRIPLVLETLVLEQPDWPLWLGETAGDVAGLLLPRRMA